MITPGKQFQVRTVTQSTHQNYETSKNEVTPATWIRIFCYNVQHADDLQMYTLPGTQDIEDNHYKMVEAITYGSPFTQW